MPGKLSEKEKTIHKLIHDTALELEFLDSSDEETEEVLNNFDDDFTTVMNHRYSFRSRVPKSRHWFENVLPQMDESRFKQCIRVTRSQFDMVLQRIQGHPCFQGKNSSRQLSTSTQLALLLYRLGCNGDGGSIMKMTSLFGIGDGGTMDKVTKRVFKSILAMQKELIQWPTTEERNQIVVRTIDELPRCVGYLDGCEFRLAETPTLDHVSYYSRKQQYSVKAQAVCDDQLRIRDLVIGYPGSVHDARIFSNCDLAVSPAKYFTDSQYLAADSAYRLTDTVITPFRRNSRYDSSKKRKKFNKYFSAFRVRVEHCFGVLKERFPSLKELRVRIKDTKSHKFVCEWILVCCILHNMLIPFDDPNEIATMIHNLDLENEDEEEFGQFDEADGDLKRQALFSFVVQDK